MLPLAMISPVALLLLAAAGWLALRLVGVGAANGRFLGIVAVVAGLAFFLSRSDGPREQHRPLGHDPVISIDTDLFDEPFADRAWISRGEAIERGHGPARWVSVVLGTALVILGVLVFGRGGARPLAVKSLTVLGAGAILYAAATFFGDPPRSSSGRLSVVSRHDDVESQRRDHVERDDESRHAPRAPRHAKRPAMRPHRGERMIEVAHNELPSRAGEIPVAAELASAAAAESTEPAVPAKSAEPAEPAEPAAEPAAPAELAEPAAAAAAEAEAAAPVVPVEPQAVEHIASAERPAWVEAEPRLVANGVYAVPVHSGLFRTVPECQRELEAAIKQAADLYVDDYLGDGVSQVVDVPVSYLNERVKKLEFSERVQTASVGPMYQIHALLEFDNQVRADLRGRQREVEVANRLWYTAGGAGLVLSLLAIVYGYLRLDLRTGGAHKGSLQLAATLVALIVAAGLLLVRWAVAF